MPDRHRLALKRLRFDLLQPAKAHARRLWKARQLRIVTLRPSLDGARIVTVLVVRNEAPRLPHFLKHYRRLGVEHFLIIDNGSNDGTQAVLADEQDVSIYEARGEFVRARYGNDWANTVLNRHCRRKWVLYVDADELLVYTGDGPGSLGALCDALERRGRSSLSAVMLDMYSDRPPQDNIVRPGMDPLEVCPLYDAGGYVRKLDEESGTVWVKGGVRGRIFFRDALWDGPALNKTPLVRWSRRNAFLRSAHLLWPRSLNRSSASPEAALLHFKFTALAARKVTDADNVRQHTSEYLAYGSVYAQQYRAEPTRVYRGPEALVAEKIIAPTGISPL